MTRFAYTSVTDPRFVNAEQTMIDCLVVFPTLSKDPLPFTAVEVDPGAEHGEEIFRRCLAGEFGPVAPWEEVQPVVSAREPTAPLAKRRARRARKPAPAPAPKPTKKRKPAAIKPPKRKR